MKKHIAIMISCIMFAVCFCYPVFAVTAPGKTITTSYNYGDVSINVSVNASAKDAEVTGNNYYQHRFTVTLTNKTNNFQVAATNLIGLKLYTGSDYTFDAQYNNSDGTFYTLGSWTSEVTSYSDNMTVPTLQFYNSSSENFKGCVYITFKDSDVLVLNPNETRTYDFTIDFICDLSTTAVPLNGNVNYSYFTYTGNVSIYNKPSEFTSNTVEDFLNNDSFPNSIIPWLMASYEQGIVDQQKYDEIIDKLTWYFGNQYFNNPNILNSYAYVSSGNLGFGMTTNNTYVTISRPYIVSSDTDINYYDGTDLALNYDRIYASDVTYTIYLRNTSNNDYLITNQFIDMDYSFNPVLNTGNALGFTEKEVFSNGMHLILRSGDRMYFAIDNSVNGGYLYPSGGSYCVRYTVTYYYGVNFYGNTLNNVSFSSITYTFNPHVAHTLAPYNLTESSPSTSVPFSLAKIIDLLTGNKANNDEISDESGTVSDTESQIHEQEQQWYSDNESAIEATGLSNFEFTSDQLTGMRQLRLQFSHVWDALGDWTLVYIFVMSLSLATFILRHRPSTKAQQRMADSAKYRQDVRNRWAVQDARASNNSNGFSDEIWRRAGY